MAGDMIYRQWEILQKLQASRFGITVEELSKDCSRSVRTIKRDLSTLELAGFDLVCDNLEHGRKAWRLNTKLDLSNKLDLSMTEMLSMFLSRQLLLPLAGTPFGDGFDSILLKISKNIPNPVLEYFESLNKTYLIKLIGSCDYSSQKANIEILNRSIQGKNIVKLSYRSAGSDEEIASSFHPYGMISLRHELYCIGYLQSSSAKRHLKVSRIKSVKNTGEIFQKPTDFSLEDTAGNSFGIFSSGESTEIKVIFSGWAGIYVSEANWHGCTGIEKNNNDEVVATFKLGNTKEFKSWLLGFGRHAKVIEPAEFANEIQDEVKMMLK